MSPPDHRLKIDELGWRKKYTPFTILASLGFEQQELEDSELTRYAYKFVYTARYHRQVIITFNDVSWNGHAVIRFTRKHKAGVSSQLALDEAVSTFRANEGWLKCRETRPNFPYRPVGEREGNWDCFEHGGNSAYKQESRATFGKNKREINQWLKEGSGRQSKQKNRVK